MPMAALASPTVPRAIRLAVWRVAEELVVGGLAAVQKQLRVFMGQWLWAQVGAG